MGSQSCFFVAPNKGDQKENNCFKNEEDNLAVIQKKDLFFLYKVMDEHVVWVSCDETIDKDSNNLDNSLLAVSDNNGSLNVSVLNTPKKRSHNFDKNGSLHDRKSYIENFYSRFEQQN